MRTTGFMYIHAILMCHFPDLNIVGILVRRVRIRLRMSAVLDCCYGGGKVAPRYTSWECVGRVWDGEYVWRTAYDINSRELLYSIASRTFAN